MKTLKEIKKTLELVRSVRNITSAFYEIASLRMRQIRESTLRNRSFFQEIVKTYKKIGSAFVIGMKKKARELKKEKEKKPEILVFLSANELLYGTLISDIWKEVQNYLRKSKADLLVTGLVGKRMVEKSVFAKRMVYLPLDDNNPTIEQIGKIVEFLKEYQQVTVFFGRYFGGLIQKPTMEKISGTIEFEDLKEEKKYLFEPSPDEILDFFESEILGVLFNITILEHKLARYAARTLAMSEASEKAKKAESELIRQEIKIKRELLNKKQVEIFNYLIS